MIQDQPKPQWTALPRAGCRNVEFRVLLASDVLSVAQLRFAEHGTIDEHAAPWDIDVICTSGSGFTSVGADTCPIAAGQAVRWPRDAMHRLWTESAAMETLMVEHRRG